MVNPEACTSAELYGAADEASGDWHEGLLPRLLRTSYGQERESKWLVLDGDVHSLWMDGLRTVFGDTGTLLVRNKEALVVAPATRFLIETSTLQHGTPQALGQCGVVMVRADPHQWHTVLDHWVEGCAVVHRAPLKRCFDHYVPVVLEHVASAVAAATWTTVVPRTPSTYVSSVCALVESLLATAQLASDTKVPAATAQREASVWVVFHMPEGDGAICRHCISSSK